jgi:hypothetical protein
MEASIVPSREVSVRAAIRALGLPEAGSSDASSAAMQRPLGSFVQTVT